MLLPTDSYARFASPCVHVNHHGHSRSFTVMSRSLDAPSILRSEVG